MTDWIAVLQRANISDPKILAVAGFSPRTCHGGVLIWNNASEPYTSTLNVSSLPYNNFTVQVYVLDANHLPGVSLRSFQSVSISVS